MGGQLCLSGPQFSTLPSGPDRFLSTPRLSLSLSHAHAPTPHAPHATRSILGSRPGMRVSRSLPGSGKPKSLPCPPSPGTSPHPPQRQNLRNPAALRAAEAGKGGAAAHDAHGPRVPGGQEPHPHRHGCHLQGEDRRVRLAPAPGESSLKTGCPPLWPPGSSQQTGDSWDCPQLAEEKSEAR